MECQYLEPDITIKEEMIEDVLVECETEREIEDRMDCVHENLLKHQFVVKGEYQDDLIIDHVKEEPMDGVQVDESQLSESVHEEENTISDPDNNTISDYAGSSEDLHKRRFVGHVCSFSTRPEYPATLCGTASSNTCDFKANRKADLKGHVVTRSGGKRYSCNICDFKANRKLDLKDHMLTHAGEKTFSCTMCEYRTTRKHNLTIHMLKHSREKPYSCNHCDYTATVKRSLARHMLTHSGEKPRSGTQCVRELLQSWGLNDTSVNTVIGAGFTDLETLKALSVAKIDRLGLNLAQECLLEKGIVQWRESKEKPSGSAVSGKGTLALPSANRAAAFIEDLDVVDTNRAEALSHNLVYGIIRDRYKVLINRALTGFNDKGTEPAKLSEAETKEVLKQWLFYNIDRTLAEGKKIDEWTCSESDYLRWAGWFVECFPGEIVDIWYCPRDRAGRPCGRLYEKYNNRGQFFKTMSKRLYRPEDEDFAEKIQHLLNDDLFDESPSSPPTLEESVPSNHSDERDKDELYLDDSGEDPDYLFVDEVLEPSSDEYSSSEDDQGSELPNYKAKSTPAFKTDVPKGSPHTYPRKDDTCLEVVPSTSRAAPAAPVVDGRNGGEEVLIDDCADEPAECVFSQHDLEAPSDNDSSSDELFLDELARHRKSEPPPVRNPDIPREIPLTYLGKNDMEWHSQPPNSRVKVAASNVIRGLPGLSAYGRSFGDSPDPIQLWDILIDEEMINEIVVWTNNKLSEARSKIDPSFPMKVLLSRCWDTNKEEINALIGISLLTSILKGSTEDVGSLFSSGPSGRDIFRAAMSEERYEILMSALRFDNPTTRSARRSEDKAAPILWYFEKFVANCKKPFVIGEFTCIDEMLIPFRGKCPFRVYMPLKPAKYGLKIQALTDARNSYFYHGYIYSGIGSDGKGLSPEQTEKFSVPTQSILKLTECIKNSGRNVTADNWYCSVEAAKELQKRGLTLVGIVRKNKRDIPPEFLPKSSRPESSTLFGFNDSGITLASYVPKKNRAVVVMSTMHRDAEIDSETKKPEIIMFHNKTKGGVDCLDQRCSKFPSKRNSSRWPMAVFFRLVDIASSNAHILYLSYRKSPPLRRFDFIMKLGLQLITPQLETRLANPKIQSKVKEAIKNVLNRPDTPPPMEMEETRLSRDQRKTCSLCPPKLKRKTAYLCHKCKNPICLQCAKKVCCRCFS